MGLEISKNGNTENFGVVLLRAFASIIVVFFHINEPIEYTPNFYTQICKLGWLGVPIFFVVSGYCIGVIEKKHSSISFIKSRIVRIWPPYLASLALCFVVILTLKLIYGTNSVAKLPEDFLRIFQHIFLLIYPLFSDVKGISWVYWSLITEVIFYLYFSVCLKVRRYRRAVVMMPLFLLPLYDNSIEVVGMGVMYPIFWVKYYPYFLMGYLIIKLQENLGLKNLFCIILVTVYVLISGGGDQNTAAYFSLIVILIFNTNFFNNMKFDGVTSKFVGKLSGLSYSLYLVHVPIGCWILINFREELNMRSSPILHLSADLLILVINLCVAHFFYKYIEKYFHQISRKFTSNRLEV